MILPWTSAKEGLAKHIDPVVDGIGARFHGVCGAVRRPLGIVDGGWGPGVQRLEGPEAAGKRRIGQPVCGRLGRWPIGPRVGCARIDPGAKRGDVFVGQLAGGRHTQVRMGIADGRVQARACGVARRDHGAQPRPGVQTKVGARRVGLRAAAGKTALRQQRTDPFFENLAAWLRPNSGRGREEDQPKAHRLHHNVSLVCYAGGLLQVKSVTKEFPSPAGALHILSGISFELERGAAVAIMGPSGSGKSTLLSILGALDPPTSGEVRLGGQDPYRLGEKELAAFRNKQIGFVFQDHCLLPQCTVLENVLLPTLVATEQADFQAQARQLLDRVGLGPRVDHLPAQLSGGEKQRVAIARALIRQPALLLCDEPTGNLDRVNADSVADLLLELQKARQMMLVLVTHSEKLAARAPVEYELSDGRLVKR